jgi:hypothetical protein
MLVEGLVGEKYVKNQGLMGVIAGWFVKSMWA